MEDAGCEGFFKAEGSAGKRAGDEADKLSRGTRESESSFESSKMKLSENIHVRNKAKAHHVPKDTVGGLDQYTTHSRTARRKGGVRKVDNSPPIFSSFGTRSPRAFQRSEKKTVRKELAPR